MRVFQPTTMVQDPELQLTELREYAHRRNWMITSEYVDTVPGSKDSRPQLNRLMAEAHQRKFDAIVVWKIDRFGRSLKHLVNAWLIWPPTALPSLPCPTIWTCPHPQAG